MATWLIVIIVLAAIVFVAIIGLIGFGLGTQRRDRRHIFLRRARRGQRPPGPPPSAGMGSEGGGSPAA